VTPADSPSYFPLATSTPFLVTNSGTPSDTVAPWGFQATSSSCGSTNTNVLMQWENNSGATPGAAYLLCNGSLALAGSLALDGGTPPPDGMAGGAGSQPFDFNSNATSSASTAFAFNNPVCSVSNTDVMQFLNNGSLRAYVGCDGSYSVQVSGTLALQIGGPDGIVNFNGPIIATSDGNGVPSTQTAGDFYSISGLAGGGIYFGLTGAGGAHQCGLLWTYPTLTLCSSGASVSVPSLENTGLASSNSLPLCGASGTAESQCTLTPSFATTGSTSVATGTTANSYQQLGGTQSITTGTSNGPNGEWLVKITMPVNVGSAGLSGENVYGCIVSLSTFTIEDATKDGSNTCVVLPVSGGGVAGTVPFGQTSSSGSSPVGLSVAAEADVIVANSTTLAVKFEVAGSTATSATVYGYGNVQAVPY
jgi:hypothetical protein